MAKEFIVRVGQPSNETNFNWVVKGMGKHVYVIRVEEVSHDEFDEPIPVGESEFLVYHTGPHDAVGSVPGEGFIYPDSPLSDDGEPIPRPWNPQSSQ